MTTLRGEAPPQSAPQPIQAEVDLDAPGFEFRAWGTSLAWWANGVGAWPEPVVDDIVRRVTDPADGLGLTYFRYNIGGGDQPGHAHMRHWGDVPGFKPSKDGPYDWTADEAQRSVLLKLVRAVGKGAIVEAFSNSPPWWMTVSGCAAGSKDGGANLKPEFEQPFAAYLADVCAFYRDRHGLVFDILEPMNEPDVNWWRAGKNQEGCHVPRDQQARLIRLSRAELDARGLASTRIAATDANNLDDALKSLESFDEATLAALGQVNAHSYSGKLRAQLRSAAAARGKPLYQSESGPLYVGGNDFEQIMKMAKRIVVDLNELQPEVWATWQVVSGGPWGCLHEDAKTQTFSVGKKFHMFAAFTRAIRPGDRVLPQSNNQVLAAVSPARREAVLVLVNEDKVARPARVSVRTAGVLPGSVSVRRTSATEDLVGLADLPLEAGRISVELPAGSVTRLTLILPQATPGAPR